MYNLFCGVNGLSNEISKIFKGMWINKTIKYLGNKRDECERIVIKFTLVRLTVRSKTYSHKK